MDRIRFFVALLLLTTGSVAAVAAPAPQVRMASVPGLKVSITLTANSAGEPMLSADFSTDDPQHHGLMCETGGDLQFALHDSAGKEIPAAKNAGAAFEPLFGGGGTPRLIGGGTPLPTPDVCKMAVDRKRLALLISDVYPNLARGKYRLQITVAPRGTPYRARMKPLDLNI